MIIPQIDLRGARLRLRTGGRDDVEALLAVLHQPSVRRWWHLPPTAGELRADLEGASDGHLLIIEEAGQAIGGIQYAEETSPDYHSASIDIFIGEPWQNAGRGREAIGLLVDHLIHVLGHHRITIDPAVDNLRAIACYRAVGFRPVGVMRQYERGEDGRFHDNLLLDLVASDRSGPSDP